MESPIAPCGLDLQPGTTAIPVGSRQDEAGFADVVLTGKDRQLEQGNSSAARGTGVCSGSHRIGKEPWRAAAENVSRHLDPFVIGVGAVPCFLLPSGDTPTTKPYPGTPGRVTVSHSTACGEGRSMRNSKSPGRRRSSDSFTRSTWRM